MREQLEPRLSKWPFFLGDAFLLGAAWFIYYQSKLPMGAWQIFFVVVCVAGGAGLAIMPFLLEYRLWLKLAEARTLTSVTSELQNLQLIAGRIGSLTGQWQSTREAAEKTATAAGEIAGRMTAEVKAFTEFMQRANDTEKATLRLEVEKARRAENDWLQVLVRVLDHVYALHQGALRSGQPNLVEQMGNFQAACRDAARRVGLAPFTANGSEPFDAQRHQVIDGDSKPSPEAMVAETLAAGYTFQGNLLRPALVRLSTDSPTGGNQSQLPLEQPVGSPGSPDQTLTPDRHSGSTATALR
jgi:molecular chaperone GrpE (heat shock protein)